MAWNPSPEVADCREIARRRKYDQVILVGIDIKNEKMHAASYGETKALCAQAAKLSDAAYDAVYKKLGQIYREEP